MIQALLVAWQDDGSSRREHFQDVTGTPETFSKLVNATLRGLCVDHVLITNEFTGQVYAEAHLESNHYGLVH